MNRLQRLFALLLTIPYCLACTENAPKAEPWKQSEFGTFTETSFEDLNEADQKKIFRNINRINIGYALVPYSNHTSGLFAASAMRNSRELFYLLDIDKKLRRVTYSAEASQANSYPIIKPNKGYSIEYTRKSHYGIRFDFEESHVNYEYETTQKISREKQQLREFKEVFQIYSKNNRMGLPRMPEVEQGEFSYTTIDDYKTNRITQSNIDTSGYVLRGDTLHFKLGNDIFYKLLDESFNYTKLVDFPVSESKFYYDSLQNLIKIHQITDNYKLKEKYRSSREPAFPTTSRGTEYQYSHLGLLLGTQKYDIAVNTGEKITGEKIQYAYQVFSSPKAYYKVAISFFKGAVDPSKIDQKPVKTLYFDEYLHWVKIEYQGGEANRRIDYE